MVHLATREKMQQYVVSHLEKWINEHSNQIVLVENGTKPGEEFHVSFYTRKGDLNQTTKKYQGVYGPTIYVQRIPSKKAYKEGMKNAFISFKRE